MQEMTKVEWTARSGKRGNGYVMLSDTDMPRNMEGKVLVVDESSGPGEVHPVICCDISCLKEIV
jgi:hypothetical protein